MRLAITPLGKERANAVDCRFERGRHCNDTGQIGAVLRFRSQRIPQQLLYRVHTGIVPAATDTRRLASLVHPMESLQRNAKARRPIAP